MFHIIHTDFQDIQYLEITSINMLCLCCNLDAVMFVSVIVMPCSYCTCKKKKKDAEASTGRTWWYKVLLRKSSLFFLFINHKLQVTKCILRLELSLTERIEQMWDCVEGGVHD